MVEVANEAQLAGKGKRARLNMLPISGCGQF